MIGANDYGLRQFKGFVEKHPVEYVKLTAIRAIKYFSPVRPLGFWFYQSGWKQFVFISCSAMASFFLFLFGFAGVFLTFARERQNHILLYIFSFVFLTFLSVIPALVETRYRLPVYPFMAVFAGFFFNNLFFLKNKCIKYLAYSFIFLVAISSVDLLWEYEKVLEKINVIFKNGK